MPYKTIILELLEQRPQMYDRLRRSRKLLRALDGYSRELKARHQAWTGLLVRKKPESNPSQIASEALELAISEIENLLPSESPADEAGPLSLDGAMAYIRRHTRPA